MIKRLFSLVLFSLILNYIFVLPAVSQPDTKVQQNEKNIIINTTFVTDLNLNKASDNQVVQFKSYNDYKNSQGYTIPKGTLFNGKIKHLKKSRFGYRRAKAVIKIDEMVLPSEQVYKIKGRTNRHVLKGSATKNIAKGIVSAPVALVVGAVGCTVIAVEAVSIVGLLIVGPTAAVVGGTFGKLTNGVDYKKEAGDQIDIKIKYIDDKSYNNINYQGTSRDKGCDLNSEQLINQDREIQSEHNGNVPVSDKIEGEEVSKQKTAECDNKTVVLENIQNETQSKHIEPTK